MVDKSTAYGRDTCDRKIDLASGKFCLDIILINYYSSYHVPDPDSENNLNVISTDKGTNLRRQLPQKSLIVATPDISPVQ
jgi:hypothetical protein